MRRGELTGNAPLYHALKLNLWGKRLVYQGLDPKLVMGSLLALPPGLTAKGLGLTTEVGGKLFHALQDYGAYVSDDSGWDAVDLCAEVGVEDEVKAQGLSLASNAGPLYDDEVRLIRALQIVDNNAPTSVSGGGTPRRPLSPPLLSPAKS